MNHERSDGLRLDEELDHELRAFAAARLSPDRAASARMRAAVLQQAHEQFAGAAAPQRLGWLDTVRLGFRRLAPIALVGAMAVSAGTAAGVAASPGGPLYGIRLQVENALLPAGGDARTEAQANHLDQRIDEAAGTTDAGAIQAALAAYQAEVDAALDDAGSDPTRLAQIRSEVEKHLVVLQQLELSNPAAVAAIQDAITASQTAIARIDARTGGGGPGGSGGGPGGSGGGPGNHPTPPPQGRP